MVGLKNAKKIPECIRLRGCINCIVSKNYKERHGIDYGFDHELILPCLIVGCMENEHAIYKPFINPEEAIRFSRKSGNEEHIENARKYLLRIL